MNQHIRIIPAKEENYEEYYRIRCNRSDIYWMGHKSKPDYELLKTVYMERLWNSKLEEDGKRRIYLIETDDIIIGFVMLSNIHYDIEIGISIKREFQNVGFGGEAIQLSVKEAKKYSSIIYARIRDDNIASQRIFIRNNFLPTNDFEIVDYPVAGKVKFRKYIYKDE